MRPVVEGDEKASLSPHRDEDVSVSPSPLLTKITPLNVGMRMVALLIVGCGIALAQHGLYSYVDGEREDAPLFPSLPIGIGYTNQSAISFLGTQISKLAVICFCAAIGLACTQVCWWYFSTRTVAIRHIDAVEGFAQQPLNILNWRAILMLRLVTVVVLCQALLDFVSTITPGSITVHTGFRDSRCTVHAVELVNTALMDPTVNSSDVGDLFEHDGLATMMTRAVVAGAHFAPPSPCGICEYNLQFFAPGARCEDVTQSANITVAPWRPGDDYVVWDATVTDSGDLLVQSTDMTGKWSPNYAVPVSDLPTVAISCSGWNVEYNVSVNYTAAGVHVTARNLTYKEYLGGPGLHDDSTVAQQFVLWATFTDVLFGKLHYNAEHNNVSDGHNHIAYSSLIADPLVTGFTWKWADNLTELIPQLLWNSTLALLSGELTTSNNTRTAKEVDCRKVMIVFVYDRARLFITYGVALAISVACVACGALATSSRGLGRGESSGFSRTLAAYPSTPSTQAAELTPDMKVRLGDDGRLLIVGEESRGVA